MSSLSKIEKITAFIIIAALLIYVAIHTPGTHPMDDGDQPRSASVPQQQ